MACGPRHLLAAVCETAANIPNRVALEDVTFQQVTYRRLLVGADLLAREWRSRLGPAAVDEGRDASDQSAADLTVQPASIVRRDRMSVQERGCIDDELGVGIPDDEIRVIADLNASLPAVEPRQSRRRR